MILTKPSAKTVLTAIAAAALPLFFSCARKPVYTRIEGFAQGGTYHIIYSVPQTEPIDGDSVVMLVSGILRDIDFSISGYNKGSLLSRFNAGTECVPDKYMTEAFELSRLIWEETEGLFDVSGGPLFDFWGFGFSDPTKLDSLKVDGNTARKVDSLLQFTGMDKIRMENGRLIKEDPRAKLNFNAIAQGYTCDVIAKALDSLGVNDYLVEVGMEIVCKGMNASGKPWRIALDAPVDGSQTAGENIQDILELSDCAIVTSGNYRKYHMIDGEKYSHSINPITGYPSRHSLLSATVIISSDTTGKVTAENKKYAPGKFPGAYADAYATYCMVIGKDAAESFIRSRPDLEGYLIYSGGTVKLTE